MSYLLSAATLRQLNDLLGRRPSAASGQRAARGPVDTAAPDNLPFDLFWCASSGKFRVYLPQDCARFQGHVLAADPESLTAVENLAGWYEFAAPEDSGLLCAVAESPEEGAAPLLRIAPASAENMTAKLETGSARLIAYVQKTGTGDAVFWQTAQAWRGSLDLGSSLLVDSDLPDLKRSSLEFLIGESGELVLQLTNFDKADTTGKGITEILEADPESGRLNAKDGAEDYQAVVVYKGSGGERRIAYMPFGAGDGGDEDPDDNADCGVGDYPGEEGGGGGGGGGSEGTGDNESDDYPGDGADQNEGTDGDKEYPGKAEDCW